LISQKGGQLCRAETRRPLAARMTVSDCEAAWPIATAARWRSGQTLATSSMQSRRSEYRIDRGYLRALNVSIGDLQSAQTVAAE
jgi:hypothetical protein